MKPSISRRVASFFAAALLAVMPLAHQAAEAGSIGRSSSSSSVSRTSTTSRPAAAPSPSRIGGASKSVGMSRPDMVNQAKQQSVPVPRPTPAPSYAQRGYASPGYATAPQPITVLPAPQAAQVAPREGPGWGTVAAAGLGGALAGHLLTERSQAPAGAPVAAGVAAAPMAAAPAGVGTGTIGAPVVDPATGAAVAAPVMAAAQPTYVTVAPQPKDHFATNWIAFCFGIVLLGVLALMALAMWRKSRRPRANAAMLRSATTSADSSFNEQAMTSDLPFSPMAQFWDIQRAYSHADSAKLRSLLGPDLADEMIANAEKAGIQPLNISGASYSVADDGTDSGLITIRYVFMDGGENVVELWHFIDAGGDDWRLNGIDTF